MSKAIFINLPVKDMQAARTFYTNMGFSIKEEYSNDDAVFVIIAENIHIILLAQAPFKENAERDIADTTTVREVTVAIQLDSREDVDKMVDAAITAGGAEETEGMDDEMIYSRGVCDLDGHRLDINYLK
jgi:predicted lactoylglutathione lyase